MENLVELVQRPRQKTLLRFVLQLLRYYFRIEVEGLEHLPKRGRALILPNHSGFTGIDAVLLTFIIKRETRRRARILAHRAFFDFSKRLKTLSESQGLRKASIEAGIDILEKDHLLVLFPEGETGNFKSSLKRYELQEFHTGFLRMGLPAAAPIIPCLIIGAEESSLNLANLDLTKWVRHLRIPLPVNLLPLPAKWKIVFLPPIPPDAWGANLLENKTRARTEARKLRLRMQRELRARLRKREYIYFEKAEKLLKSKARRAAKRLPRKLRLSKR
ncbi:MAG: 1-acyl-sn-glycerol-3-phosphate acyltransferase [Oligoflexia bacterium]|nr:1-acyl-sn-glycerol-3-phosphate acyltransferase [Oligoflexia bacterium]